MSGYKYIYDDSMWWGYLHTNGNIVIKQWFGDIKDFTEDVEGNDFIVKIVTPFEAIGRKEAEKYLADKLKK
jgi:hypothetical protein